MHAHALGGQSGTTRCERARWSTALASRSEPKIAVAPSSNGVAFEPIPSEPPPTKACSQSELAFAWPTTQRLQAMRESGSGSSKTPSGGAGRTIDRMPGRFRCLSRGAQRHPAPRLHSETEGTNALDMPFEAPLNASVGAATTSWILILAHSKPLPTGAERPTM